MGRWDNVGLGRERVGRSRIGWEACDMRTIKIHVFIFINLLGDAMGKNGVTKLGPRELGTKHMPLYVA